MKHDHLLGHPPAVRHEKCFLDYDDPYPLGEPKRVRDAAEKSMEAWRARQQAERTKPRFRIDHRNQTARDVIGCELAARKVVAEMHAECAATGMQVMCTTGFACGDVTTENLSTGTILDCGVVGPLPLSGRLSVKL